MPRERRIALTLDEAVRLLALAKPRTSSDMALLAQLADLITQASKGHSNAP